MSENRKNTRFKRDLVEILDSGTEELCESYPVGKLG